MLGSLTNLKSDRYGLKTILQIIIGIIIYSIGQFLALVAVNLIYPFTSIAPSFSPTEVDISFPPLVLVGLSVLQIVIPFLLIWLYIVKILKMPLRDFRICKPKNIGVWILCALALPLAVSVIYILLIPGTFTISKRSNEQVTLLIIHAVFMTCLVAGISEELLFRGFIMHLLEVRWNKYIAIILPSMLFAALHIGNLQNPIIVEIILLLVAGTSVGIMFSMIAYQSGSIWSSAIVHGMWNLITNGGILNIGNEPVPSIFTYTEKQNSGFITGGGAGIECSLLAIVGYGMVIFLAWFIMRRKAE